MTPATAAKVIGCTVHHVRFLIRKKTMVASQVKTPWGTYCYEVNEEEVNKFKKRSSARGRPRKGEVR